MERCIEFFNPQDYIETSSGNKISRKSVLSGSQNIVIHGKSILMNETIIRGDLSNIKIGRYCIFSQGSIIRPSIKKLPKGLSFIPIQIGDHVFIGKDTIINCNQLSSFCFIGNNCVLGHRSVIKESCVVMDNTVIPSDATIPPYSIVSGNPYKLVGETPEITPELMAELTRKFYQNFQPKR